MCLLSRGFELGWRMSQPPKRFIIQSALACPIEDVQFGIFSVGDVTTDPATERTPTDHERIRATVEIARLADDVGLGRRIDEAVGELRSCLAGPERRLSP